jgi:UPF0716 protein FxsA
MASSPDENPAKSVLARLFPLILLLLPLVEIAGFVIVGSQIGVLWTIALVLASSVAGASLLRYQGFGVIKRMQAEVQAGRDPGREIAHGAMILLAAVLLLIPGFVTDIFGLLLFIPPVRELAWRFLKRRVDVTTGFVFTGNGGAGSGRGRVIDLDEGDYSSRPDKPDSPWKRFPEQ